MRPELQKKIDFAIRLLKEYDNPDNPIEIAYSGGKDSDVILQLAKEAGIHYRAIYKNTTIDPPGTISHVKAMGVEVMQPKETFFQIVARRGYPNRIHRICCAFLKEYKVGDKTVIGVRKAESVKRSKIYQEPTACHLYRNKEYAELVYPILEWTDQDVADFIADRGIKCHPLYYDEQGQFHVERRLGCMGCPLAYITKREDEFRKYPKLLKAWLKAGRRYIETHPGSVVEKKYGDEYAYFYRNMYCASEQEYQHVATGLFGKPDFKGFLEKYFNIELP